jgi:transposase
MDKGIRFTDGFKRDAVAQVVERGYAVSEVAERLGISTKSLYALEGSVFEATACKSRGSGSSC